MTDLAIAGLKAQKGDWLTFFTPKAHPDWSNKGHIIYLNDHGFIQIAWGERTDTPRNLPVSSDLTTDLAPLVSSIWRRDDDGAWCCMASVAVPE